MHNLHPYHNPRYPNISQRARSSMLIVLQVSQNMHCKKKKTKKKRRFYGKIIGNQLPVHAPFFTGARKHFQESGTVR